MTDIAARARELLNGIKTPGIWMTYRDDPDDTLRVVGQEPLGERYMALPSVAEEFWHDGDAEFIAAAPELVAELLDQLDQANAALERVREFAERLATVDTTWHTDYIRDYIRNALEK